MVVSFHLLCHILRLREMEKKASLTWEIHLKVNINRMSGVFPFSTNIYKRYSIVE